MSDYDRYEDEDDFEVPQRRSGLGAAVESVLLLGALALIASPAIKGIARRYRVRHPDALAEDHVDKSLKDTFPASDPPAQRYVDIPINRR